LSDVREFDAVVIGGGPAERHPAAVVGEVPLKRRYDTVPCVPTPSERLVLVEGRDGG
jgi:hypothetical protein